MLVSVTVSYIMYFIKQTETIKKGKRKVKRHAQTYQMRWPDQLSQVKEKTQHNIVSQERKKAM